MAARGVQLTAYLNTLDSGLTCGESAAGNLEAGAAAAVRDVAARLALAQTLKINPYQCAGASPAVPRGDGGIHGRAAGAGTDPEVKPSLVQELLPRYREVTEAYMAALLALGFRLLRALALALDLPPEHFRPFFDPPSPFLRPLHYAARASAPEQVDPTS